jgi:hypothetical protein
MKKAFTLLFVISALLVSYVAYTNQGNPPAARTNAPGEGNCTGCHSGSLITSGTVWSNATLTTSTSLGSLQPNTSYTMNLTFADPSSSKYGFQLVALPSGAGASTASIGSLTSGTGSQTQSSGGRSYLNQTSTGTSVINNTKTWTFTYTTPTSFNGNIVFHTVLNATNSNNSSSDDDVYYKAFSATVLPVSWYKLVAERETENTVIINWTTAQEINNDYFVVERSADMKLWEDAGTVKGSGNTTNVQKYTYHDLTSSLSYIYYRIRQVDFDGTTSYSNVLSVSRSNMPSATLNVYPNPFTQGLSLEIVSLQDEAYNVIVTDLQGRTIATRNVSAVKGLNTISMTEMDELKAGIYFVKLIGQETITLKVVKAN